MLDFFHDQKQSGLLKGDYDEDKYWEGMAQDTAGKDLTASPDWTMDEKLAHKQKIDDLSRTSTTLQACAKWLDRFSYW